MVWWEYFQCIKAINSRSGACYQKETVYHGINTIKQVVKPGAPRLPEDGLPLLEGLMPTTPSAPTVVESEIVMYSSIDWGWFDTQHRPVVDMRTNQTEKKEGQVPLDEIVRTVLHDFPTPPPVQPMGPLNDTEQPAAQPERTA